MGYTELAHTHTVLTHALLLVMTAAIACAIIAVVRIDKRNDDERD